jgi:two-component system phosphate regulon sensor histidine kinase PhoR
MSSAFLALAKLSHFHVRNRIDCESRPADGAALSGRRRAAVGRKDYQMSLNEQTPRSQRETPGVLRRLRRWRRRLFLRRWLFAVVGLITLIYALFFGLDPLIGLAGVAVVAVAAGALPREGILNRRPRRESSRHIVDPLDAVGRLIDGLPEPAIVLSRQGLVLRFNTQAAQAYTALQTGLPVSTAVRHPQLLDAIDNAASHHRHQVVSISEVVPVERWLSAAVSWIGPPGAGPGDPAIFIFLRDLTEQERIGQMRADFVANASHELKTPLASVLGFIETLRGPARDDEKARDQFLGVMAREAERMKRVIDDLLSLSRVEMKAHLRPTDLVEINEVLDYARGSLERLAAERNITIELQRLDRPSYVLGEREGLVQVFENLVNNAIKYGREGGLVRIVAAREGGTEPMLSVSVIDDGPGIPEEHLPRLTERFYRVNVADSRDRGGTGLGLSIVKHVLNRHRGQLRIASNSGEGSRFTVLLPEQKQAGAEKHARAASPRGRANGTLGVSAENHSESIS